MFYAYLKINLNNIILLSLITFNQTLLQLSHMEQDQEYEQYLTSLQQDDYNYVQSLLFNYGDAVVPREHYWF